MVYTPFTVLNIFFIDSNSIAVNAGRVFFLAGLALFLDDLPDVNKRVEKGLNWIKTQAFKVRKPLHITQFGTGVFALYCSVSILLDTIATGLRALPNSFVIVSLLITSITSFSLVKRKAWLNITLPEPKPLNAFH
jgi:hypothetical protein